MEAWSSRLPVQCLFVATIVFQHVGASLSLISHLKMIKLENNSFHNSTVDCIYFDKGSSANPRGSRINFSQGLQVISTNCFQVDRKDVESPIHKKKRVGRIEGVQSLCPLSPFKRRDRLWIVSESRNPFLIPNRECSLTLSQSDVSLTVRHQSNRISPVRGNTFQTRSLMDCWSKSGLVDQ